MATRVFSQWLWSNYTEKVGGVGVTATAGDRTGRQALASLLVTWQVVFLNFGPFSGFENWIFEWLSRENLDLQNNNERWRYFVVEARIYTVSLLDFILFHRRELLKMLALEQSA